MYKLYSLQLVFIIKKLLIESKSLAQSLVRTFSYNNRTSLQDLVQETASPLCYAQLLHHTNIPLEFPLLLILIPTFTLKPLVQSHLIKQLRTLYLRRFLPFYQSYTSLTATSSPVLISLARSEYELTIIYFTKSTTSKFLMEFVSTSNIAFHILLFNNV
jgi:hypothetical protein